MKTTLKLPGLPPAVSQIVLHFVTVFLVAFGTQLVAGASGITSESSLLALLTSAAAAGVVAIAHLVAGLVPSSPAAATLALSPRVRSATRQVVLSVLITFVTIFGAQLAGGAVHVESLPGVTSLVIAAISAAVTGVVTFLVGLVPAPVTPA